MNIINIFYLRLKKKCQRHFKFVEIHETKDENDGWPKVTENQTNCIVSTGINRDVRGRNIIYYVITVVENKKTS